MSLEKNIIRLSDIEDQLDNNYFNGQKVGTTTYFPEIDTCWKWRPGELNLLTGYMGEGKSEVYKQLSIIKALKEGKKFAMFVPENMPADEFYTEMIFPFLGKNPYKHSRYFNLKEADYKLAKEFLDKYFFIVHPKSRKLNDIEQEFVRLKETEDIFGVLVDPFLKISHDRNPDASYIADFMGRCGDFAKSIDVSYTVVAHQLTPEIGEDQNYKKPDPYRIKGGGNFADGADNVLIVWRPMKRTDKGNPTVHFESAKIKRHELVSVPNDILLEFDYKTKWYRQKLGFNPIEKYWYPDKEVQTEKPYGSFDIDKANEIIDNFDKEDVPF